MFKQLIPLIAGACMASHTVAASAQEELRTPSAPLQHPGPASGAPNGGITMLSLRVAIEQAADATLCEVLMTGDGHGFPAGFKWEDCTAAYRGKLVAGEGKARWRSQASRPQQCGSACLGRPFIAATRYGDRPNLREAVLYGHLDFTASEYGISRDLTYGYTVHMQCRAENGARNGEMVVNVDMGTPVIEGPGALESTLDFLLLPVNISRRVEARIRSQLSAVGDITHADDEKLCSSIGVDLGTRPASDAVRFDTIPRPPASTRPRPDAVTGVRGDRVKVEFLSLTRKPLPSIVSADHAQPGSPAARQFRAYLNGVAVILPPPLGAPDGLDLPPAGGTVSLNYCRTIPVDGWDGLQLLFVNDLGGAVWSQFPRSARFGAGDPRRMTTMRSVLVPASTPGRPRSIDLREFELLYRITWLPEVAVTAEGTGGTHGGGGRPGGPVASSSAERATTLDTGREPATPCREI